MEDPKAKPSGLDVIKKGLATDGSYLIVETGTGEGHGAGGGCRGRRAFPGQGNYRL